jgi:hypothetical protein
MFVPLVKLIHEFAHMFPALRIVDFIGNIEIL